MLIDTRSHGFPITEGLRHHATSLAEAAFRRAQQRIASVAVQLSDINGDHGGDDKACQIRVKLHPAKVLVTRCVHHDMYTAIGQAIRKAKSAIRREFERRNSKHARGSLRRPFSDRLRNSAL